MAISRERPFGSRSLPMQAAALAASPKAWRCVCRRVLAQQLGWVRPLPLLAAGLSDPALRGRFPERRPRPADPDWATACHLAYAHAAARAHDLARELDRRAHVLLTVAPRLRAKEAPKIVAALLADDAVTASSRL